MEGSLANSSRSLLIFFWCYVIKAQNVEPRTKVKCGLFGWILHFRFTYSGKPCTQAFYILVSLCKETLKRQARLSRLRFWVRLPIFGEFHELLLLLKLRNKISPKWRVKSYLIMSRSTRLIIGVYINDWLQILQTTPLCI